MSDRLDVGPPTGFRHDDSAGHGNRESQGLKDSDDGELHLGREGV